MSILIKGMEMPKDGDVLTVKKDVDGKIYIKQSRTLGYSAELIELPAQHGRLIDADALSELCDIMVDKCGIGESIWHQFRATVEQTPAIIPAEEVDK